MVASYFAVEVSKPEFEHHETPDFQAVIGPALKEVIDQAFDSARIEIAALQCSRIQKQRKNQILQFVSQPML
jgi:hypothetical protein